MATNLRLDWATHEAAKYACENWHYSKCIPKSKLVKIGVWENSKFIGVVIYGVGATAALLEPYGLKPTEGCELTRVALTKHKTPVSRIISISLSLLKKSNPGLKLVVSFADTKQGHHGGIYQATNWVYCGKTKPCKFPIINGKITHPRTLSLMVKSGRVKDRQQFKHVLVPGKHRYLYVLDNGIRTKIERLRKPYPKRAVSIDNDVPANHAGEGGVNPTTALQNTTGDA